MLISEKNPEECDATKAK